MLNGIDPVIIIQLSKLAPNVGEFLKEKIPSSARVPTLLEQPPIPIYLSESLTGLFIDSEDKNVDINTDIETLSDGSQPEVNQKGIGSSVTVQLKGKRDSVGLILLSAVMDLVFEKVTSKEYSVTYMHGATTIFRGNVMGYQVNQNAGSDLLSVSLTISKGQKQPSKKDDPLKLEKATDIQGLDGVTSV